MTKNYFAIERGGNCLDHVCITNENGTVAFEELMSVSYDAMKSYADLESFIVCVMDVMNKECGEADDSTLVTLVGEDDVFIWGILIGPGENDDELVYKFIDWKADGKSYRYEKD